MQSGRKTDLQRRLLLKGLAAFGASPWLAAKAQSQVATSITKRIPKSNEVIPAIGLGTSRVFEVGDTRMEREGPLAALNALANTPGAMIDTSPMYGSAERVIGELLPETASPTGFFLASKVWTHGKRSGVNQIERSFERLNTSQIDLMQIHNLVDWQLHIETLRELKTRKRIRYIGITHYLAEAHTELEAVIEQIPDLDFLQINYSLLEPEAGNRLIPLAKERGIAVIANRPFARGRWFSRLKNKPLPGWCKDYGIATWAQYGLRWIISNPAVTCAIPGTDNAKHMLDNMAASQGPSLPQTLRERMQQEITQF